MSNDAEHALSPADADTLRAGGYYERDGVWEHLWVDCAFDQREPEDLAKLREEAARLREEAREVAMASGIRE
jgi:hypothetical protein